MMPIGSGLDPQHWFLHCFHFPALIQNDDLGSSDPAEHFGEHHIRLCCHQFHHSRRRCSHPGSSICLLLACLFLSFYITAKGKTLCAGIFKQSVGARNRVGVGLYRPARPTGTYAGGIDSLKSIYWAS
jgi:hypothetical protein